MNNLQINNENEEILNFFDRLQAIPSLKNTSFEMPQTNIIQNYKIGSDFELFLFDKNKDEVINAKKYVKGTKKEPFNFDKSNQFWCTSLDNISMEGNIPPCSTGEEFSNSIQKVIDYMNSTLPENLCTIHTPAVYVNPKQLNTKESRTLGCEPTLNAYTEMENPMPDGHSTNLRTCCTHVHLSYDNMNKRTSFDFIKACDLFLGVPSLLIEPSNQRRVLYGKLGECRLSNKTIEYRVLSSYFSKDENLRQWVFNNTVKAIEFLNEGNRVSENVVDLIHEAFYHDNTRVAKQLIREFNIPMPL